MFATKKLLSWMLLVAVVVVSADRDEHADGDQRGSSVPTGAGFKIFDPNFAYLTTCSYTRFNASGYPSLTTHNATFAIAADDNGQPLIQLNHLPDTHHLLRANISWLFTSGLVEGIEHVWKRCFLRDDGYNSLDWVESFSTLKQTGQFYRIVPDDHDDEKDGGRLVTEYDGETVDHHSIKRRMRDNVLTVQIKDRRGVSHEVIHALKFTQPLYGGDGSVQDLPFGKGGDLVGDPTSGSKLIQFELYNCGNYVMNEDLDKDAVFALPDPTCTANSDSYKEFLVPCENCNDDPATSPWLNAVAHLAGGCHAWCTPKV